jgi:hypothetical protein
MFKEQILIPVFYEDGSFLNVTPIVLPLIILTLASPVRAASKFEKQLKGNNFSNSIIRIEDESTPYNDSKK